MHKTRADLSGQAVPLSAVYRAAFAVGRQKCRTSRMNLIKICGVDIQRIKLNQVYFELHDFFAFCDSHTKF
jgi:hypothetical protein